MLKKLAALGLTAAIAFAPLSVRAQNAAPDAAAATPDAAAADTPKPMKKMKHHSAKHMMKKHKKMKMKAKEEAPSSDATPAADAPK